MKQRYNELTEDLIFQAVKDCFAKKWERNDVSSTVEEYEGIRRQDISREIGENKNYLKQQAIIDALKEDSKVSKERADYLQSLNEILQEAIKELKSNTARQ